MDTYAKLTHIKVTFLWLYCIYFDLINLNFLGIFITGGLNEDERSETQAFSPVGAYDCTLPTPEPLRYYHSQDGFLGKYSKFKR